MGLRLSLAGRNFEAVARDFAIQGRGEKKGMGGQGQVSRFSLPTFG